MLGRQAVEVWAPQLAELLEAFEPLGYVAGGAARQVMMGEDAPVAGDVDVFLYHRQGYENAKAAITSLGYSFSHETSYSATYGPRDASCELAIQLIRPFKDAWSLTFGPPEAVLTRFSFTTEMFAVERRDEGFEGCFGGAAWQDTLDRRLVVQNVTHPAMVALRASKYVAKGYSITAHEICRVLDAWAERPADWRAKHGF